MPTNDAWLLVRVLVGGPADLAAASEAIGGFRVEGPVGATFTPVAADAPAAPDAKTFVTVVTEALSRSGENAALSTSAAAFPALGLPGGWGRDERGNTSAVDGVAARTARRTEGGLTALGETVDGWSYPKPGMGEAASDDTSRALVAMGGLAMLPRVEAIYLTARGGADGTPFDGAKAWRVHVPAHVRPGRSGR